MKIKLKEYSYALRPEGTGVRFGPVKPVHTTVHAFSLVEAAFEYTHGAGFTYIRSISQVEGSELIVDSNII